MGFLADMFTGQRPDYRLPGYAEGMLNEIRGGINPSLGFAGRQFKKVIKQYDADPMSLAGVSQARGAVARRNVDEDYMQGANRIIAQTGGEQANIQQRMKEQAKDRVDERTGLESMQEANTKYFGSLEGFQRAKEAKNQQEQSKYGMMSSLLGLGYDARKRGGIFNPETWSDMMKAFAGGAGAGMTAGG